MSNPEQLVSTVVGGVIGFFVGGGIPGAIAGAQYGLLAGTVLFPPEPPGVQGPRLEDFEQLAADPGAAVWRGWGTFAVPGFRLYLGPGVTVATTEQVGGKGPDPQEVTTYRHFQTVALGLCAGPIAGVLAIWENGELVYDVREQHAEESLEDYEARIAMSEEYASFFVLHLGTSDQMPDTQLEAELGVGNVPAFRDLAYIVWPNREVRVDQGGRHPVFKVLVASRTQELVTSKPYAIEAADGTGVSMLPRPGKYPPTWLEGAAPSMVALSGGHLGAELVMYDWPAESVGVGMTAISGGHLDAELVTYDWPAESVGVGMTAISGGHLDAELVTYDWPAEGVDVGMVPLSGGSLGPP